MRGSRTAVGAGELWAVCRERIVPGLDELAQRVVPCYGWDDIVLPPDGAEQLRDIADQVAHRATVHRNWGFGVKLSRGQGISALFAGPSGTGNTMAAEILAGTFNLDLYRIDLAGVVSKYIGETEKNLRRIFDAAEAGGAVLFFDEADALFGKRSEVKDSHDRYAKDTARNPRPECLSRWARRDPQSRRLRRRGAGFPADLRRPPGPQQAGQCPFGRADDDRDPGNRHLDNRAGLRMP